MKRLNNRLICAVMLVLLAIAANLMNSRRVAAQHRLPETETEAADATIVGTWIATLQPTGGAPFSAMASFHAGGTFSAVGATDRVALISDAFGSWKRTADGRFQVTQYSYTYSPMAPNGPAVALFKSDQLIRLEAGNRQTGIGNLRVCDLSGQNCGPSLGTASINGRRIVPEDDPSLTLP